jgi:protoporphyrinogen oxidase
MRAHITGKTIEEIFNEPEITTRDFLKQWKLSNRIIDRFFQPFFSGIFLENELETSARMFQFIFKMFSEGNACLPAKGIEAIAVQLKLSLAHASFRLNCKVKKVEKGLVTLEDGETIKAKQIIVATDAAELMPQLSQSVKWNSTQQLYFSADKTTLPKKYIALNFKKEGLINNLAVLSDVSPAYAPYEKKLISVCLRNSSRKAESELVQNVLDELATCLGAEVKKWHYLRGYQIKKALPIPADNAYEVPFEQSGILEGIYLAGDQMLNPSLNGAMLSGELAAKALILNHKSN